MARCMIFHSNVLTFGRNPPMLPSKWNLPKQNFRIVLFKSYYFTPRKSGTFVTFFTLAVFENSIHSNHRHREFQLGSRKKYMENAAKSNKTTGLEIFWFEWKYFCEKLNHDWSHCDEGLSVASVFFVKGAVTWLDSTYILKDLPETTERKSKALILVIASCHLKESWWVFSRVFHLFSMKWQLTRQLISINWRLISESCLVQSRSIHSSASRFQELGVFSET